MRLEPSCRTLTTKRSNPHCDGGVGPKSLRHDIPIQPRDPQHRYSEVIDAKEHSRRAIPMRLGRVIKGQSSTTAASPKRSTVSRQHVVRRRDASTCRPRAGAECPRSPTRRGQSSSGRWAPRRCHSSTLRPCRPAGQRLATGGRDARTQSRNPATLDVLL